ncbi:MAG: Holliday junction branch migration protein RuvA [Candidatus Xenobia bacterium]
MIAHVAGRLDAVERNSVVVDVGGLGYQVLMAMSEAELSRWQVGQTVKIPTHLAVREDDMSLFGFRSPQDRAFFRLLLGVSGIGPKAATAILMALDAAALTQAILGEKVAVLTKVPGIGAKSAQRLVLELKEKVRKMAVTDATQAEPIADRATAEVVEVLEGLGCPPEAARDAVERVLARGATASDFDAMLAEALKVLSEKK